MEIAQTWLPEWAVGKGRLRLLGREISGVLNDTGGFMTKSLSILAGVVLAAFVLSAQDQRVFKSPELGFSIQAPVVLTTDGTEQHTTTSGKQFTQTVFTGGFDNGDTYFVCVSQYPFVVVQDDLQRAAEGFAAAIGGTVNDVRPTTVSGQPALRATISLPDKTTQFAYVAAYKGKRVFQFAVGTLSGTPLDSPKVNTFFESATITGI